MNFLYWAIIGLVAGWLASLLVKGRGLGLIGDIIVGIIGAFLGGWLFGALGVAAGSGLIGSLVTAFVGAVVLLAVVKALKSV
ncbi:MAG TPA: GlsB/YeaQ/YmgE family stress response membrane protein [Blastocatellia bacterium]|nr:GlsB/YeaQ/YmgE family stress response membrane protein [Blastocatellia bacterium]